MGTQVALTIHLPAQLATVAMKHVRAVFVNLEQRLSRFLAMSELSRLNRQCGQWVTVSRELAEVLHLSAEAFAQTAGVFDPRVLKSLDRLGYVGAQIKSDGVKDAVLSQVDRWLVFREYDTVQIIEPIDLGGIGKGYALDVCARYLRGVTDHFLLSAGGDIVYKGQGPEGAWRVGVEWPFATTELAAVWALPVSPQGAICTSADSKRFWIDASGTRRHHLIDPSTGLSGGCGLRSVTVLSADSAVQAEVWSKTLYLRGLRARTAACPRPTLAISEDGELLVTPEAQSSILWSLAPLVTWTEKEACR